MNRVTADLIITNTGKPLENGVIIFDEQGKILDLIEGASYRGDVRKLHGVITPGFVNAHCHLELSHLKGQIPSGTGLITFIESVLRLRDFPEAEILDAIRRADKEMYENGIVAVGDISNKSDTARTKNASRIHYHTFVEMFDFFQKDRLQSAIDRYTQVYRTYNNRGLDRKSFVPHSPYTVSPQLFDYINHQNRIGSTVCIHNQETQAESDLFFNGRGELVTFYKDFGFELPEYIPTGGNSLEYAIKHLSPIFKTLMVHNTLTTKEDVAKAHEWNSQTYWVTCPNANLYIENKLPNYDYFMGAGAKICIGTDSLSSNWQLSILEEMKTIQKFRSAISPQEIIKWATWNGACALSYEDVLGAIEIGKTPGLNWLETSVKKGYFKFSEVKKTIKLI